jgi:hypothetical protein
MVEASEDTPDVRKQPKLTVGKKEFIPIESD